MSPSEPETVEAARARLWVTLPETANPITKAVANATNSAINAFEIAVRRDERARIYRAEHDEKYGVSASGGAE
jgi:hypothetical protein